MIKVLIVDDQKTVQEIIKGYIEEDPYLEFVGSAYNGQEALDLVKAQRPNIVLMDIEMPVLDGLTATKIISEQFIDTNVIIISVHNEDSYLNTALQVGAKGYLLKNTPEKELINAVYSAHKGYFQLGPGLLEKYLHKVSNSEANTQELQQLKTIIIQQSEYLENLSYGIGKQYKSVSNNDQSRGSDHRNYLENQYAALDKQIYILSNRIDRQNKKIAFLQQFCFFIILCCAVLAILVILFNM
jgi:YesN/AraC family two-component response regulator